MINEVCDSSDLFWGVGNGAYQFGGVPDAGQGVPKLVNALVEKTEQILLLNPNARVYIQTVLPTRDRNMNRNVMSFNNQMQAWLNKHASSSVTLLSAYAFLDRNGLLATPMTRDGDCYHLGSRGIARFVSLLKDVMFKTGAKQRKTPTTTSEGSGSPT